MKVYIRHAEDADARVLTEVTTAAEAEDVARSVRLHGAYSDHEDPTHKVGTQYLVTGTEVGFEIILGVGQ